MIQLQTNQFYYRKMIQEVTPDLINKIKKETHDIQNLLTLVLWTVNSIEENQLEIEVSKELDLAGAREAISEITFKTREINKLFEQ